MKTISLKRHTRIDFHYFLIATLLGGILAATFKLPTLSSTIMLIMGLYMVYRAIQLFGHSVDNDVFMRFFGTNLIQYLGFLFPMMSYWIPGPSEKSVVLFFNGIDFIIFGLLLYLRARIINAVLRE